MTLALLCAMCDSCVRCAAHDMQSSGWIRCSAYSGQLGILRYVLHNRHLNLEHNLRSITA